MSRELRVSFIFILVYFIYGLTSLISLGDFVTLHLFSKLNLILIAVIFIVLHIRSKQIIFDLIALLGLLAGAVLDDFSLYYLAEKFNSIALIEWGNKVSVIYFCFFILYTFYAVAIYMWWRESKRIGMTIFLSLLIIGSIMMLFKGEFLFWNLILAFFFISYFICFKLIKIENNSIVQTYAALFLFQVIVESMKYFYV